MKEKTINGKELVKILYELSLDKKYKKNDFYPKFTIREAQFIKDLIFQKPKDIVYFYLADHISTKTDFGKYGLFNTINYRKYLFIKNYFICGGNATKTAVLSGYSPRSAKQQGHRILKQIQRSCRDGN